MRNDSKCTHKPRPHRKSQWRRDDTQTSLASRSYQIRKGFECHVGQRGRLTARGVFNLSVKGTQDVLKESFRPREESSMKMYGNFFFFFFYPHPRP